MRLAGMGSAALAGALSVDAATDAQWLSDEWRVSAVALFAASIAVGQPVAWFFAVVTADDAAQPRSDTPHSRGTNPQATLYS